NEIFNFIANSSFAIDIKIDFGTQLRRERRLDELLVAQLLQSPYYITYFNDIYTIPLSKHKENTIIANLQENIDLSLQMNDKDLFYQLTQILNIFKHRNHNSTMRD
ncbi:IDEAL domain-containing protein, partial [Staphylococcus arlettae]